MKCVQICTKCLPVAEERTRATCMFLLQTDANFLRSAALAKLRALSSNAFWMNRNGARRPAQSLSSFGHPSCGPLQAERPGVKSWRWPKTGHDSGWPQNRDGGRATILPTQKGSARRRKRCAGMAVPCSASDGVVIEVRHDTPGTCSPRSFLPRTGWSPCYRSHCN